MLMLGDILARARAATPVFQQWLESASPGLAQQLHLAAAAEGETFGSFVRGSVAAFDRDADAEAWTRLTGRLHAVDDPGRVCLEEIVRWRLSRVRSYPLEKA